MGRARGPALPRRAGGDVVTPRAQRTWLARIQSGTMTKSQCQQYARVIGGLIDNGQARGHRTSLDHEAAVEIHQAMRDAGGVRLTPEHTAQGLSWLERYAAKRLPMLPVDWRERFDHFAYMGGWVDSNGPWSNWSAMVPVWRIVLNDGETWDYYATAWQSGDKGDHAWQALVTERHA